jgi:hypothetical protein
MERKYKIRLQRKSGVWYAHTEWDAGQFDIETTIIAMGDTPEQAYNEWERLVGRRKESRKENAYVWLWLIVPSLIAGVLVWIFG